jgi:hypothetical protein
VWLRLLSKSCQGHWPQSLKIDVVIDRAEPQFQPLEPQLLVFIFFIFKNSSGSPGVPWAINHAKSSAEFGMLLSDNRCVSDAAQVDLKVRHAPASLARSIETRNGWI